MFFEIFKNKCKNVNNYNTLINNINTFNKIDFSFVTIFKNPSLKEMFNCFVKYNNNEYYVLRFFATISGNLYVMHPETMFHSLYVDSKILKNEINLEDTLIGKIIYSNNKIELNETKIINELYTRKKEKNNTNNYKWLYKYLGELNENI